MEAVKILMPRIQKLDPVNASSIMCNILMQAGGENEIIRLAFVPESFLLSYINKVKASMGVSLDVPCSKPSSLSIGANPTPYPQGIMIPNNGFHLTNPPNFSTKPISYADVLSGSSGSNLSGSPGLPFLGGDELLRCQDKLEETMRDQIVSPGGRSDSVVFPYGEDMNAVAIPSPQSYPFHRRSFSVNDAAFLSNFEEGSGFGWRPCVYYARGYCKNGSSCKFVHSDIGVGESQIEMGSPSRADSGFDEMLRFKALQQQQHQHQQKFSLMASGGHHPLHYNKWMNFLAGNQRNDFSPVALRPGESSSLRQIYLTFPADSTFKEDDVFRYFSKFGPVHDVRIPYQQKRMFGFVTFYYPETVKQILAKGNPHFVCDSRVLVKPYKEKGKVAEKKQLQHQYSDRGEFSTCLSPSGIDSNELGDLPIGPRMLQNTQEMMRRKKMEQEMELQHAIELQGQRMMNLQIMDRGNQQLDNRFLTSMLGGVSVPSPLQSQLLTSQKTTYQDVLRAAEFDNGQEAVDHQFFLENGAISTGDLQCLNNLDSYSSDSNNLEHALPENLFTSPTKSAAEHKSIFFHTSANDIIPFTNTSSNNTDVVPSSSSFTSASSQTTSH